MFPTCFEHCCAHHQEVKFYYTASGIVTLCRWPSGAHLLTGSECPSALVSSWDPEDGVTTILLNVCDNLATYTASDHNTFIFSERDVRPSDRSLCAMYFKFFFFKWIYNEDII